MTVQLNFDASTVEPARALSAIPAGEYTIALIRGEAKETKAKDSWFLECEFTVLEGEYKGRRLFKNLNLWNQSQQASEIAWRQLSAIAHAVGVLQVPTIDVLYNIPMKAQVQVESDPKYGDSNRVGGFEAVDQPGAGGGSGGNPPWANTPTNQPAAQPPAPQPPTQPAQQEAPAPNPPTPAPNPPAAPGGGNNPPPWAGKTEGPAKGGDENLPPWAR